MASNTENVSIWWCHHVYSYSNIYLFSYVYSIVFCIVYGSLVQNPDKKWECVTIVTTVDCTKLRYHDLNMYYLVIYFLWITKATTFLISFNMFIFCTCDWILFEVLKAFRIRLSLFWVTPNHAELCITCAERFHYSLSHGDVNIHLISLIPH